MSIEEGVITVLKYSPYILLASVVIVGVSKLFLTVFSKKIDSLKNEAPVIKNEKDLNKAKKKLGSLKEYVEELKKSFKLGGSNAEELETTKNNLKKVQEAIDLYEKEKTNFVSIK